MTDVCTLCGGAHRLSRCPWREAERFFNVGQTKGNEMYALIAQVYWPVLILADAMTGSFPIGVASGVLSVIAGWMIAWKLQFGTFRFWSVE